MLFLFSALLFTQFANAETDLLNLDAYQEGDTPAYGEDIVVAQDENTGIKWITQQANALDRSTMSFPISLFGDFEVFIKMVSGYFSYVQGEKLFLIASDEYKIMLASSLYMVAGNDSSNLGESGARKTINSIRISVTNNIAKVYLNDVFDGKITLKPDQSYSQLIMQGIQEGTKIYELKVSGNGTATTTPNNQGNTTTNPTTTSSACKAKYDAFAGRIIIPCIEVPDAFGGIQTYYIEMQQQPGTASFDLDFNTVKPVQ